MQVFMNIDSKEMSTLFLVVDAALLFREKLAPHVTVHTIAPHYRHMSTYDQGNLSCAYKEKYMKNTHACYTMSHLNPVLCCHRMFTERRGV